jgi:outer membrane lipopolysaccharide assembly protein LptE/RlpB
MVYAEGYPQAEDRMKRFLALPFVFLIAACGVETATTAATSAEIKKRELEAGQRNLEQAKQKIEAATQQLNQNAAQAEEKSKD